MRAAAWLVGSRSDHERYLEMEERATRAPSFGALITATQCVAALTYGWPVLVSVAAACAVVAASAVVVRRCRVPEVASAVTVLLLLLVLAAAAAVTGAMHSPLLPFLVIPLLTQAVWFRAAVSAACAAATAALVLVLAALELLVPAVAAAPAPPVHLEVLAVLTLLCCLATAVRHLARSDADARGSAAVDVLTGAFNRRALSRHFDDAQARMTAAAAVDAGRPEHRIGHLLHRTGGEEFVVLAPGAGPAACEAIGERLVAAVRSAPLAGLAVTVSAGAHSERADGADLARAMAAADGALYAAKGAGRDRVVRA